MLQTWWGLWVAMWDPLLSMLTAKSSQDILLTYKQSCTEHIDGLVQERRNSSALATELRLSCAKPSMSHPEIWQLLVWEIVFIDLSYTQKDCKNKIYWDSANE